MTDGKDAASLRELGTRYREGNGVDKDPVKAVGLLAEASELGDAQAASSVGYMLMVGEGVPADASAAEVHLRRAAEAGNTVAMCNLGVLLSGTVPDESISWFGRAAEAGSLRALKNLATAYSTGSGVPLDKAVASEYYRKAADLGDVDSMCVLASMLRNGDGIPVDKAGAADLYRKAAELGDPDAQYDLAFMLDVGEGIPQDRAEAEKLFRLSADQGDTDACLCIGGILYERGDFQEAEGYFTDAALKGDVKAMYNLGLMYSEDSLGEPDLDKAEEWFESAAQEGFAYAQTSLAGILYNKGDVAEAAGWYRKSAAQGEPTAMYNLGALALSGRIEMPDRDAIRLLTASAESGICEARDLLMRLSSQGMLRSLVPDQQILQAGDLVPAGQVLGHESVGTLDYGAVHAEGVRRPGIVVAVADEERPVAGDVEPRERERHRLGVGLVGVGVVPSHDGLGDVPEPLILEQVHDLVAHLARHDADTLAPLLEDPQDAGRLGERLRLPVGVRGHGVVEPGAVLVVGVRTLRISVEDVVHGHPEVPRELLPPVLHADHRQYLLEDPVDAGARVVQGVVEVEEVEVVLPHFVPT